MTKILVLSDTHLEEGLFQGLEEMAQGADLLMHAGDFVTLRVYDSLAVLGRLVAVHWNADPPALRRLLPARRLVEVQGVRIGLVHRPSLSWESPGPGLLAREMDVDVLVFGHLHRPFVEEGRRLLLCPGSPTLPRMSPPAVAEIEIKDGKVSGRILPLDGPACEYFKYAESLAEEGRH